jgi:HEAT repeat protein
MTLEGLFKDKAIKAKAKVAQIGNWVIEGELTLDELLAFTETQNGANKATCIEAIEYATKKEPDIADESLLAYVTKALKEDEPRIKWESAKVIGNVAKLFSKQLTQTINNLLINAEHSGTVVRWATAFALGEILKLKTENNKKLLPTIEKLCKKEKDNGVKKKYLDAVKKIRTK